MEGVSVRIYMYACPSLFFLFLTTVPVDFTLGGCIADNPGKCSVECEVVLVEQAKPILLRHFTSKYKMFY